MKKLIFVLFISCLFSLSALEFRGFDFPDKIESNNKNYVRVSDPKITFDPSKLEQPFVAFNIDGIIYYCEYKIVHKPRSNVNINDEVEKRSKGTATASSRASDAKDDLGWEE